MAKEHRKQSRLTGVSVNAFPKDKPVPDLPGLAARGGYRGNPDGLFSLHRNRGQVALLSGNDTTSGCRAVITGLAKVVGDARRHSRLDSENDPAQLEELFPDMAFMGRDWIQGQVVEKRENAEDGTDETNPDLLTRADEAWQKLVSYFPALEKWTDRSISLAPPSITDTMPVFGPSDDYRSVIFKGQVYTLTRNQAKIIKILHEAFQRGTPCVGKDKLLAAVCAVLVARPLQP